MVIYQKLFLEVKMFLVIKDSLPLHPS